MSISNILDTILVKLRNVFSLNNTGNRVNLETTEEEYSLFFKHLKEKGKEYYTLQEFGDWLRVYRRNYK